MEELAVKNHERADKHATGDNAAEDKFHSRSVRAQAACSIGDGQRMAFRLA
jgi:hypothetical protein